MSTVAQKDSKALENYLRTLEFRVSYPHVFKARAAKAGDIEKFSISMVFRVAENPDASARIPGEAIVSIDALKALVRAAIVKKFGEDQSKWPTKVAIDPTTNAPMLDANGQPKKILALRLPYQNGNLKGFDAGTVVASASSKEKPGLVDQARKDIVNPNDFYAGCYARATVDAYYYDNKGNQGIALGLKNIQKVRDGEPLGNRRKPTDDFDAIAPAPGPTAVSGTSAASDFGV